MMTRHVDTCNFALMPYAHPVTHLVYPLEISSWSTIKRNANLLMEECLDRKSAGGEISIQSSKDRPTTVHNILAPTSHLFLIHCACGGLTIHPVGLSTSPVLVVFMWASGAAFETKLNRYENDPFSLGLSLMETE